MKNFKLFKRSALLLAVVVLAVVLTVGAIAGAALLSDEGSADYGEQYAGVKVGTSGKVSLKFYYSTTGTAEEFVAKVIDPETGTTETQYFAVADLEETGDGFCVPVALAPSQMTHTVKIYASGTSGNGAPIVYSVKEYAEDVLADASKAEYHDAMRALLNWGGMAQVRFQDATSSPAHANLFERGTNSIYHVNTITYTEGAVVKGTTITGNEMNLSLEPNNLAIHFYVNYTGNGTLTATVSKNGGTPVSTNVTETDKGWLVRVANVPASLFDTPYTVTVTDGTDTFTATKTVREYLGVQLAQCNANNDSATGNVVRALYQLYQFVTGNTGAADCAHSNAANRVYWISAGEGTQRVRCNLCHADLGHQAINAGVNAYAPAKNFLLSGVTGSVDKTLMKENGVQFVRLNNYYANRDNWGDISIGNLFAGNTGVSGQYLVIKFRASGASGSFELYANTNKHVNTTVTEADGVTIKENKYHGLQGVGLANVVNANDGEWHTVIINLAERVADPSLSFVDEGDGTYNVRYLSMRLFGYSSTADDDTTQGRYTYTYQDAKGTKYSYYGTKLTEQEMAEKGYTLFRINKQSVSADAYVDIAYVALCDSTEDAKTLIDTDTYEVSKTNKLSQIFNTADDSCVHTFDGIETISSNTYSYSCVFCRETIYSKTIPESVKLYFSPKSLATRQASNSVEQKTTYDTLYNSGLGNNPPEFHVDSNVAYARIYGKDAVAQWIWNRGPGVNGYADGNSQDYTVNVGKATHLVIKMRSTMPTETIKLCFSTAGVSGAGYSNLPTNMTAGEWTTVIIDLERVFGSQYAAEENGDHLIDTFYFDIGTFSAANKADFAYIAFVEGGLDEVANIVDTDTALIQIAAHGKGYAVDPETCTCVEHAVTEEISGTAHTIKCTLCGTVIRSFEVSADINWYSPLGGMSNYADKLDKMLFDSEEGVLYNRFSAAGGSGNHIRITGGAGAGAPTADKFPTGKYIVIKYRMESTGTISFSIATGDKKSGNGSGIVAAQTVANMPGMNWRVAVMDVSANAQWTSDGSEQTIYMMMTTGVTYTVDIAYVAVVDSIDEMKTLLQEGETYVDLGNSWNGTPVEYNQDGTKAPCKTCVLPAAATVTDGENGAKIYTYNCTVCGNAISTKTVPAGVIYMAPEIIQTTTATTTVMPEGVTDSKDPSVYATKNDLNPQTQFCMNGKTYAYDPANGTTYFGFKGNAESHKTVQFIWNRSYEDHTSNAPGYGRYLLDMGQSRFLVLKVRTNLNENADGSEFTIPISTKGNVGGAIKLPVADTQGDWVTYVIDLETLLPEKWVKDAETGTYIMDTFYMNFSNCLTENSVDIAYIAFVEGDWSNVDALVDEETVVNVTSTSQGYVIVKADGSAAN